MKQWISDFYVRLRKMNWVTFDHFQFLLLSSFHLHFHSLWLSVHNYFPLFIKFGVVKTESKRDGGDSSHPTTRALATLVPPPGRISSPQLSHTLTAFITGEEYWLPFTRGRITSFVSLKARISLGFEVEVSLVHVSLAPFLPSQKEKKKMDKNDVIAAGRKDIQCQTRKWDAFLLCLIQWLWTVL